MRLIKGGRVIDPANGRDEVGSLLVDRGVVKEFIPGPDGPANFEGTVVDAKGLWVVPGLIDMHVHLRDPGHEWKEDVGSGTAAAAAGGFTTVACMANTNPVNDSPEVTRYILERAKACGKANVLPVAAVTKELGGKEMADYGEVAEAGAVAFSDDGRPVANPLVMRRVLDYLKRLGLPVLVHAEVPELAEGGAANEGFNALRAGIPGIPAAAEDIAIARDIELCRLTGGRVHFQHVSTATGVELIRRAKAHGLPVTCETAPHYFTLTDDAIVSYDTHAKMSPPLRTDADRKGILAGLADGTIDAIATDHAPHDALTKRCDFVAATNGIIGLQTALPLALSAMAEAGFTPSRLVDLLSTSPARILGQLKKGHLGKGADADITLVDPTVPWIFDDSCVLSKSKNSPFLGWTLKGRAVATIRAGRATHSTIQGVTVDG